MADKMNAPQLNAHVKKEAVAILIAALTAAGAVQTGDFSYDLPIVAEGETHYVRMDLTARNMKGTTKTAPFDLAATVAAWEADKAEKAAETEKKEAEKKAKADKAAAKKKDAE